MLNNKIKIFDKIIVYLIKGLIFILPLFFLPAGAGGPWTFEFFEFNKMYLLWIIIPLIAILWLFRMVFAGQRIVFKKSPLDIPILFFLGAAGLASIFSINWFSSIFGYQGNLNQAWLGLLSLVLFYFIIINLADEKSVLNITSFIKILIFSFTVYLIIFLSSFFNGLAWLFSSLNMIAPLAINTLGNSFAVATIFSLIIIILALGRLFELKKQADFKNTELYFYNLVIIFTLFSLALINFSIIWWGLLIVGLSFLLILRPWHYNERIFKPKIIWPIIFIIIAGAFIVLPNLNISYYLTGQDLPLEEVLDYKNSSEIGLNVLKNNLVLGSGPGSFIYNFSLYRDTSLNNTELWQLRYNQAGSYIIEIISTLGILGILSYLLILSLIFYLAFFYFKKYFFKDKNYLVFSLALAILILILYQFLYVVNTALLFLFWFLLAALIVVWQENNWLVFKYKVFNFKNDKKVFNIIVISLFLLTAGFTVLAGFEIKFWLADYYAKQGGEKNLIQAEKLNKYRYEYKIILAKYYLNTIKAEMIKPANYRDSSLINNSIENSINWARAAANQGPDSVIAQEVLGMVYRDIRNLTQGSETWAIEAFREAVRLEPTNPVLLTELGKAYLSASLLEEAKQSFNRALELKSDYYEAKFGLANVYSKDDQGEKALNLLDELNKIYNDPELYYEQGRLYYNQGKTEEANEKFLEVIKINPNHANALYSLGLSLEAQGLLPQALEYFNKVLELNPGNIEVEEKIEAIE